MKAAIIFLFVSTHLFAKTYFPDCVNKELVQHTYYSLCYSEQNEQAAWSAHYLTVKSLSGAQNRTNNFRVDPNVSTESANKSDYKNSGFDRGHLVPAGDMKLNRTSMSESFFMSNISPQSPGFNRGVWRRIEKLTRKWAQEYGGLFVVTGPILEKGLPTIGQNVSIPRYFYKIIFDASSKKQKMLAFLIENKNSKSPLKEFVTTVDEIEQITGIDFFHEMSTSWQNQLESQVNLSDWSDL